MIRDKRQAWIVTLSAFVPGVAVATNQFAARAWRVLHAEQR